MREQLVTHAAHLKFLSLHQQWSSIYVLECWWTFALEIGLKLFRFFFKPSCWHRILCEQDLRRKLSLMELSNLTYDLMIYCRGIIWAFLFSWILMLIVMVLFVSGGLLYTEGCRYFVNLGETPESQVFHTYK